MWCIFRDGICYSFASSILTQKTSKAASMGIILHQEIKRERRNMRNEHDIQQHEKAKVLKSQRHEVAIILSVCQRVYIL